ncbi:hypothetical protein [Actinomadura keratinilytica]|uniref:Uncharacterized protein n=1 Tax=Actinomadura keratinilytica TaxID=547461 RepID=A0ABP7YL48_9ACTN
MPSRELIEPAEDADRHLFSTPSMVRETRAWLRLDLENPRYEQDGLNARVLGLSSRETRALRRMLSPR